MVATRVFWAAFAAGTFALTTAPVAANDGARRGAAAIQWIEGFECPVPGQPIAVGGLETPQKVDAIQRENRDFIISRQESLNLALRARNQIEREIAGKQKPGKRLTRAFSELDAKINNLGGNVTHALAQLALTGYVELSRTSLDAVPSRSSAHPLKPYVDYGTDLRQLAQPYGPVAGSVPDRWFFCLNQINNNFIADYEAEILSDVEAAPNSGAIGQIYQRWSLPGASNDSPILQQVRSTQLTRANEERREAERRRAERDAEARQMLRAQAERELGIAKRYVDYINSGRTEAAIRLLTPDVYLSRPNGSVRGRDAVARRMREAASGNSGAQVGNPVMSGNYTIYVTIRAKGQTGRMIFGFRDNLISAITLKR